MATINPKAAIDIGSSGGGGGSGDLPEGSAFDTLIYSSAGVAEAGQIGMNNWLKADVTLFMSQFQGQMNIPMLAVTRYIRSVASGTVTAQQTPLIALTYSGFDTMPAQLQSTDFVACYNDQKQLKVGNPASQDDAVNMRTMQMYLTLLAQYPFYIYLHKDAVDVGSTLDFNIATTISMLKGTFSASTVNAPDSVVMGSPFYLLVTNEMFKDNLRQTLFLDDSREFNRGYDSDNGVWDEWELQTYGG